MIVRTFFVLTLLMGLIFPGVSYSQTQDDFPQYFENGVLIIPVVDTQQIAGKYQNATFAYSPDEGWRLVDYRNGIEVLINSVELIKTDSFPVQVFLNVEGTFLDGCGQIGSIRKRMSGATIEVFVYEEISGPVIVCGEHNMSFSRYIPLSVYGLPEHEYEYVVNGEFTGTFTLDEDNSF